MSQFFTPITFIDLIKIRWLILEIKKETTTFSEKELHYKELKRFINNKTFDKSCYEDDYKQIQKDIKNIEKILKKNRCAHLKDILKKIS